MTDAQPHALYRFFGDSGVLLYVGITRDMPGRMAQHQADKHWWGEVRGVTIDWYPDRPAVLSAEARAVKIDRATRTSSWQPRSLTAMLNADEALWERHHGRCDPNPERADYWVGVSELTTPRDLLRWTLHVIEKPWVYHGTNWVAFAGIMIGVDA